jgi:hypothetical protein
LAVHCDDTGINFRLTMQPGDGGRFAELAKTRYRDFVRWGEGREIVGGRRFRI